MKRFIFALLCISANVFAQTQAPDYSQQVVGPLGALSHDYSYDYVAVKPTSVLNTSYYVSPLKDPPKGPRIITFEDPQAEELDWDGGYLVGQVGRMFGMSILGSTGLEVLPNTLAFIINATAGVVEALNAPEKKKSLNEE